MIKVCDHCRVEIKGHRRQISGYDRHNLKGTYCMKCAQMIETDRYGNPLRPAEFTFFMLTRKKGERNEQET